MSVNEVIRKLSPAERKKVEDRAAEIVAEEMSLRDLRKAPQTHARKRRQDSRHHSRQRFPTDPPRKSPRKHAHAEV